MGKSIKYVSYFDFQDARVKRGYVTAATNKMESICDCLIALGYDVEIVSMAAVKESQFKFYKGSKTERKKGLTLKLFASWGGTNKLLRVAKVVWHLIAMFVYLLRTTRKDDIVMVYHSQGYFDVVRWAKKLRKFKMILEVEEIYDDVAKAKYKAMSGAEQRMIADADAYIFPTELLNQKLNTKGLPYVIIYGTYKVEPPIVGKFADGKTHVVYAGTFDPRKGGAAAAAAAAEFLPDNYHIHICGFGSDQDIARLTGEIATLQSKSAATITFDGLKLGREYIEFMQRCHIGLSTQDPSAAFNATSFPSKILSYMANGLSVVSIDIPAIATAAIAPCLTFYKEQTPRAIAEAICRAPIANNNRRVIADLEKEFKVELNGLLSTFEQ